MRIIVVILSLLTLVSCTNLNLSSQTSPAESFPPAIAQDDDTFEQGLTADYPECQFDESTQEIYLGPQHSDLWSRLRSGFSIEFTDNKRIATHRNWYARNTSYMLRVSERANRYMYGIVEKLDERDMPYELALLPIVESAFDPFAYSHGRASGMWQFIPATGRRYGLAKNYWYDGRRDIEASTNAALDYLSDLNKRFNGDWLLALAAYNTGEGNVEKAIRRNKKAGKPTDFWSLKLPNETKAYVPQLLALAQIVLDPTAFNVSLYDIADKPFYGIVDIDSQIDLAKAAELAEIEMNDLYYLNPAFNQWATDPAGPHSLLVPIASVEVFQANLLKYPPEKRVGWENYRVKQGDNLLLISKHFDTTPEVIKKVNNLKGNVIRIGQALLIPMATESADHYAYSEAQRTERTQEKSNGKPGSEKVTYHVNEGDSLWKISQIYKVSVNQLAKWNGMAPRDPLRVGQKLVVWTNAERATTVAKYKREGNPLVKKVAYRVRNGDSLSRIASKFNLSVSDIANWNSLKKNNYIHPGQHLTLWVDLTRAY